MGDLEKTMLESADIKPVYYKWFIDDIFMIVKCSEPELEELVRHMNNQNQNIQFIHEHSKSEITFLDLTVYKDLKRSDKLQVRTFIKPTNNYTSGTRHITPKCNKRSCIW